MGPATRTPSAKPRAGQTGAAVHPDMESAACVSYTVS